jgi:hypothetical protein
MDGRPYLIGLAAAANAGSCATPIGNPQNMLIAASSGLGLRDFAAALALPSLFALGCTWVAVVLVFPSEFSRSRARLAAPGPAPVAGPGSGAETDIALMRKSLAAAGLLLVLLVFGVRTSLAALVAASALLVTRRIHPERVLREVDFTLLVFFSGLFVLTGAVGRSPLFARAMDAALPHLVRPGAAFAATVALASNLISNVPAVMLLSPVASGFADSRAAWFMLAMASTFAGNLTLLGSVANLIVAEQAKPEATGESSITAGTLDMRFEASATVAAKAAPGRTRWGSAASMARANRGLRPTAPVSTKSPEKNTSRVKSTSRSTRSGWMRRVTSRADAATRAARLVRTPNTSRTRSRPAAARLLRIRAMSVSAPEPGPATGAGPGAASRARDRENSEGKTRTTATQVQPRANSEGRASAAAKSRKPRPDDAAISMFWGLPIGVAQEPALAAAARPIR